MIMAPLEDFSQFSNRQHFDTIKEEEAEHKIVNQKTHNENMKKTKQNVKHMLKGSVQTVQKGQEKGINQVNLRESKKAKAKLA